MQCLWKVSIIYWMWICFSKWLLFIIISAKRNVSGISACLRRYQEIEIINISTITKPIKECKKRKLSRISCGFIILCYTDASSFSTNTYTCTYMYTLNAWRAIYKLRPNSFRRVNFIIVKVSCKDFELQ